MNAAQIMAQHEARFPNRVDGEKDFDTSSRRYKVRHRYRITQYGEPGHAFHRDMQPDYGTPHEVKILDAALVCAVTGRWLCDLDLHDSDPQEIARREQAIADRLDEEQGQ